MENQVIKLHTYSDYITWNDARCELIEGVRKENTISVFILNKETGKYNDIKCYELDLIDKVKSEVIEGFEVDLKSIFDFRGLE